MKMHVNGEKVESILPFSPQEFLVIEDEVECDKLIYFEIGGKRRTEGLYLSDVDGRNRTKIATPYKKEFKGIN
ncbi:hypothetical protein, partial [Pseudomonas sp. 2995-3]|uniref:hypothetical protein n=1 Tax=Pseudomonas sp. 2995-3 TaxID=1712680 RepID=UPI00117A9124